MREGKIGTTVFWFREYESLLFPEDVLAATWKKICRREKVDKERAINLVLCSDYRIKKLNRDFRDKDKATDVLSFCFDEPDMLGEIYISLQRAAVQARRFGVSYESEMNRLFVHGAFHLLGYDHIDDRDREIMEEKEAGYI